MAGILILAFLGLGWANFRFGQFIPVSGDFLAQWAAIRVYATQGIQPYSPAAWAAGARLLPATYQQAGPLFHQPLYSLVLILPFSFLSDPVLARSLWMVVLEAALVLLAVASISILQWPIKPAAWLLLVVYALLGMYSFIALISGNLGIIAALLGLAALAALRSQRDELAGLALAAATIQPELIVLLLVFILYWTLSQRRGRVLIWFLGGLFFLIALGMFFLPEWPMLYLSTLIKYGSEIPYNTPAASFLLWLPGIGRQLGWVFSGLVGLFLLAEWVQVRGKDFRWFLWTASLTLVLGQWLGIPTTIEHYVILILPLVVVLGTVDLRVGGSATGLVVAALLVLLLGLWALFFRLLLGGASDNLKSLFQFPLPAVLLIGLYWVRWWCVRPQRLYVEELKDYETRR